MYKKFKKVKTVFLEVDSTTIGHCPLTLPFWWAAFCFVFQTQHYLEKYGYLENCTLSRKKRQIPDFLEEGVSNSMQKCSESDLKEALKKLQLKFELRPSGTLDDATKKLMSKGRCGNADSERPITLSDLETNLVESSDSRSRSRRSRSKRSGQQRSSLLLDLLTRSEKFVEYPIADEDHKGEYKNRPHWRSNRDIHASNWGISQTSRSIQPGRLFREPGAAGEGPSSKS